MPEPQTHPPVLAAQIRGALERLEILPENMGGVDKAGRTGAQRVARMGFIVATSRNYPLFLDLNTKPEGWTVEPMSQGGPLKVAPSLWYWLLDALGRKRATLFYFAGSHGIGGSNAAAHLAALPRFTILKIMGPANYPVGVAVHDAGRPIQRFGKLPGLDPDSFKTSGELVTAANKRTTEVSAFWTEATAWLQQRAPEYADPTAYWDDDLKLPEQENPLG